MEDFTKRYNLVIKNAFIFRGEIIQAEYGQVIQKMNEVIVNSNVKAGGSITTCNHGINGDKKIDLEIIIPLDSNIDITGLDETKYRMLDKFELNNCLKLRHEGNPENLNSKIDAVKEYIKNNKLLQQSDFYSVVVRDAMSIEEIENIIIEVYVKVN